MPVPKPLQVVIDRWASIAHKAPLGTSPAQALTSKIQGWVPSDWTGEEHKRRLTAYMVLAAYDENSSRHFLDTTSQEDRDERREYGDAALVIEQTLAHLLGESQEVVVPGAEDYDPELVEVTQPDDADPDAEPVEGPTPDELAANEAARLLSVRQEFLREWADEIHLQLRLMDGERKAVGLGDGVYLLGWDAARGKVIPSVMDPGFYFPVLPDTLDSYEYPTRVHFAWELPGEDFPDGKERVRRITYELVRLQPVVDEFALQVARTDEERAAAETLPEGARWVSVPVPGFPDLRDRKLVRRYPWSEEETDMTCVVTDAMWTVDALKDANKPDAFRVDQAEVRFDDDGPVDRRDLLIDFLPVIHVPNTPPGGDHYGQSSLAKVLQVIDDVQNADTDANAASGTTGSPIVVLKAGGPTGSTATTTGGPPGTDNPFTGRKAATSSYEVKPGAVWWGEGADVIDTSAGLEALGNRVDRLLDRLSINGRLPAAVLGRVKPSEVPSGFAMQLSFGPLSAMIRTLRMVRAVKHPLMLKMVQRIYQANGVLPPGETPRAEIQLGAYLPSDVAGVLDTIAKAYPKFMSLETAVTMMLEVGIPIDDVAAEIARIEGRDFEGANELADLGDPAAAWAYLGREQPEAEPVQPVVVVPGANAPADGPPAVS